MTRFSRSGTCEEAIAIQNMNGVEERFRGAWFHVSQNDGFVAFDDQHDEWTFFTRSPYGGAVWGRSVLRAFLIEPATASRLHAGGEGDRLGQESGRSLPDWWLSVGKDEIDKMMVVQKYHLVDDEATVTAMLNGADFLAVRQAAVEALPPLI